MHTAPTPPPPPPPPPPYPPTPTPKSSPNPHRHPSYPAATAHNLFFKTNSTKRSTVAFGRGTRSVGLPSNTAAQKTSRATDVGATARRATGSGAAAAGTTTGAGGATGGIGGTFRKEVTEKSELQDKILEDMLDG